MANNNCLQLTQSLNKAEAELRLSEELQSLGIPKNESISLEFSYNNKILYFQNRAFELVDNQSHWSTVEEQSQFLEKPEMLRINKDVGEKLLEILTNVDMLSSLKNAFREQSISEKNPIIIKLRSGDGFVVSILECPCRRDPRRCCQV